MLIKNIVQSHVKDKDFVHLDSEGRPLGVKLSTILTFSALFSSIQSHVFKE